VTLVSSPGPGSAAPCPATSIRSRPSSCLTSTLAELAPARIKSVPKDLYPIHRATDIRYKVLPQGALIYSIMENNIDDQGINDRPNKKDDLAVGVKP